jgi:hypothetical protein
MTILLIIMMDLWMYVSAPSYRSINIKGLNVKTGKDRYSQQYTGMNDRMDLVCS